MSEWTCDKVEGWIDLAAAGEADDSTRAAVGRHLKTCSACAESHRQSQQLIGLLDQRFQESERLERLWSRLETTPKRTPRPVPLRMWRAAALAASVLLTLGLFRWLGLGESTDYAGPEITAVLRPPAARFVPGPPETAAAGQIAMKSLDAARQVVVYPLDLGGRNQAAFRQELETEAQSGALPSPPAVNLDVTIRNPGPEALTLRFDEEGTELDLELSGPGALDVPAPFAPPPLANLGVIRVPPGGSRVIPLRQLACGAGGAVHYLYWTQPGEYALTVTLRARVRGGPPAGSRTIVRRIGTFTIRVNGDP